MSQKLLAYLQIMEK